MINYIIYLFTTLILFKILRKIFVVGRKADLNVNLKGKVIIITGFYFQI
jgi:hypothetical protein